MQVAFNLLSLQFAKKTYFYPMLSSHEWFSYSWIVKCNSETHKNLNMHYSEFQLITWTKYQVPNELNAKFHHHSAPSLSQAPIFRVTTETVRGRCFLKQKSRSQITGLPCEHPGDLSALSNENTPSVLFFNSLT